MGRGAGHSSIGWPELQDFPFEKRNISAKTISHPTSRIKEQTGTPQRGTASDKLVYFGFIISEVINKNINNLIYGLRVAYLWIWILQSCV